jgi:hypothetical protein
MECFTGSQDPGFLGDYQLLFEGRDGTSVRVRVRIHPKGVS